MVQVRTDDRGAGRVEGGVMECSKCGDDKPATPKYYPVLYGKIKGRVCRDCKNKRDGHQSPQAGICQHCHKPVFPQNKRYHTDMDHPECAAAHKEHLAEQQRSYDRGPGKARRKALASTSPRKKCERCIRLGIKPPRLVKKGNYFHCEKCHAWASRVPEEYQGW